MPQIFTPTLINYQLLLHVTDNTCVMEDGNNWNHSRFRWTQQLFCSDSAKQHVSPNGASSGWQEWTIKYV